MKKKILASIMAVIITCMAVTGCTDNDGDKDKAKDKEETLLQVTTVAPQIADITVKGEYMGRLEYSDQISVFPMLSGEITNTYFEEGDYVEAGQLMFTLDDSAYQLQLQNANKTYESAVNGMAQQVGALEMQRNNALNTLRTAQEGISQVQDSYDYFTEQMSDLDKTKLNLQQDREDLKQDLIDLRKDREDAKDDLDDAKDDLEKAQNAYIAAVQSGMMTPQQLELLKGAMEGQAAVVSGLTQKISAYDSAEKQMEASIKQYDSSMDQLDSSKEGLQFQQDNLDYSMNQARRGEILAQNNLDYFDQYTLPMTQKAAEIAIQQARIAVSSAELQLSYTKITAPVSGKVLVKNNSTNDLAQAGYPVYIIIPENTKYASFNVPESVWRSTKIGDAIVVEKDGIEYEAIVTEVPTSINPQTGMFTIKAALSSIDDDLVTGTTVLVEAVTQSLPTVVTIPIDCVYYEAGRSYTYAVSKDGIISKVYIETGLYDNENIEIKSGITPDMMIITTWSSDYHDGLKVEIVNS